MAIQRVAAAVREPFTKAASSRPGIACYRAVEGRGPEGLGGGCEYKKYLWHFVPAGTTPYKVIR